MMALMPMSKQVWGATVTGTNIYISGTADKKDYILQDNSGLISGYVGDSDKVLLMTNSNTLPYSKRSFVEVQSGGVNIGSNQELNLYYGSITQSGDLTAINAKNGVNVTSAYSALYSQGSGQTTIAGWVPTYVGTSDYAHSGTLSGATINGLIANANGAVLQSEIGRAHV